MVLRLVGLVAWVGCAAPPQPITSAPSLPPPTVPRPTLDLSPMFVRPELPPLETRCRAFPLPAGGSRGVVGGHRSVVYDFVEMPLGAIEHGARTQARERRIDPLTENELLRPFARRGAHITRCWKWFAATHPGADTRLDVHLAIDVFGATGEVRVVNRPEDADLAACIRDAFAAPLYVYGPRSHDQKTQVTLQFERADQPAWQKLPARPAAITREPVPERGTVCARVLPGTVASRVSTRRVSDFDASRIPPPPNGTRRVSVPAIRVGCVVVQTSPTKANLRAAVKSNWGAYEACHAGARSRMPDLAGTIVAKVLFDARGAEPALASVSGAGDAELHACIDRALEEIWLDPPSGDSLIEANFTFPLVTDAPPAVRDQASWQAQLAKAAAPIEGCRARHDLVKDRHQAAPWIDDARVRAAVAELARFIASLAPSDAKACLAEVETTLLDYTGIAPESMARHDADRLEAHLDRLEAVLPVASIAAWGPTLRWMIALVYRKHPATFDEGTRRLRQLTLEPSLADRVRLEEPTALIEDHCAM